jgi:hypothetical protein
MPRPGLTPGIEPARDFSGFGIDAGQIRSLVLVVVVAGQRQVVRIVAATVLLGNDMLDVQAVERLVVLMNQAVFATVVCPVPDQVARPCIHHLCSEARKSLRALAWRMAK